MSLLATRNAVGLLISTLGLTKTGELTADSLTVKLPNCTPPRSNKVCANQRLSRDCSFATSRHPFSIKWAKRFTSISYLVRTWNTVLHRIELAPGDMLWYPDAEIMHYIFENDRVKIYANCKCYTGG